MNCAITGASGYLGSHLAKLLEDKGWSITEFGRRKTSRNHVPFRLGADLEPSSFSGIDTLIHCAYDFKQTEWSKIRKINVEGSIKLINQAKKAGIKTIIFISTLSAFDGATSLYGRAKREIENAIFSQCYVIRPGLIYGADLGSIMASFQSLMSISPVIPLIGGGKQTLYTTHYEDLTQLIYELATKNPTVKGPICSAHDKGRTFKFILKTLGKAKGKSPLFLSIPYTLMYMGLRSTEILQLPIGLRSDSLVSLVNLNPSISFTNLHKLGLSFRPFRAQELLSRK